MHLREQHCSWSGCQTRVDLSAPGKAPERTVSCAIGTADHPKRWAPLALLDPSCLQIANLYVLEGLHPKISPGGGENFSPPPPPPPQNRLLSPGPAAAKSPIAPDPGTCPAKRLVPNSSSGAESPVAYRLFPDWGGRLAKNSTHRGCD